MKSYGYIVGTAALLLLFASTTGRAEAHLRYDDWRSASDRYWYERFDADHRYFGMHRSVRYVDDSDSWHDDEDDRYPSHRGRDMGTLSISKHAGVPGTKLVAAGSAYDPYERVQIYFGGEPAATLRADGKGTFQEVIRVPDLPRGLVFVTATGLGMANPPTFFVERSYDY